MTIFHISDLHGRTCWKKPAQQFVDAQTDQDWQVVFAGDYVDSFCVSGSNQLANLIDVILFKGQHPDNVVLLLGNHDFQYLFYTGNEALDSRCSGFQPRLAYAFHALYHDHKDWFKIAWQYSTPSTEYLFVHAGVTAIWLEKNTKIIDQHAELANANTLSTALNALLLTKRGQDALYQVSRVNGGYHPTDGPVWVRPGELNKFPLGGYVQVVGHTPIKDGILRLVNTDDTTKIQTGVILTDCLHDGKEAHKNEFLTLTL